MLYCFPPYWPDLLTKSKPATHIHLITFLRCTEDSWTKIEKFQLQLRKIMKSLRVVLPCISEKEYRSARNRRERDKQYILSIWKALLLYRQKLLMWFYAVQEKGAFHILKEFQGALSAYLKRHQKNILIVLTLVNESSESLLQMNSGPIWLVGCTAPLGPDEPCICLQMKPPAGGLIPTHSSLFSPRLSIQQGDRTDDFELQE